MSDPQLDELSHPFRPKTMARSCEPPPQKNSPFNDFFLFFVSCKRQNKLHARKRKKGNPIENPNFMSFFILRKLVITGRTPGTDHSSPLCSLAGFAEHKVEANALSPRRSSAHSSNRILTHSSALPGFGCFRTKSLLLRFPSILTNRPN